MWESAKTVASTHNSAIIQLDVDNNFVINSTHLNMIQENKFDGYLRADLHDHIREFLATCNIFRYEKLEALTIKMDSQFQSLNKEMQEMRKNYNNCRGDHAPMNDDTPMFERHEENYIQSEDYLNRISHNSFSRQSHHDPNDFEKLLTKLNNDVRNDLEDFKRCVRSMRTIHDKLYDRDDGKTIGVLPKKKSKTVNQEPQSKTKSITKFLDGQRISNMFVKNNVNDMIIKMKQNEKNFQTKIKSMERKIDEWSKSQNVSLEQTDRTDPPPPPQAHTEHVNVIFIRSGMSNDSLKILKDPPLPILVKNKTEKDKPIKKSKKGYHVVKTKECLFREYIPKTPYPQRLNVDHSHLNRIVKDPPTDAENDTKKRRQKDSNASLSKKSKDQAELSKEDKVLSKPSKTKKDVDAKVLASKY
nr:hypothetical protein [Tanacetum cinerariifolium]